MDENLLAGLRHHAYTKLREAEKAMYQYACECDDGDERIKAFEVYENIRRAPVETPSNPLMG